MKFTKATKKQARARVAIAAPSGAGKTYTSLLLATNLGARVAVIDTEHGSASKYAWDPDNGPTPQGLFVFDTLELHSFSPTMYVDAIKAAENEGYDVIVIDSLSHAWIGKDGALDQADKQSMRGGENRFTAWRHVTPQHNALIDAIVGSRCHIIATMRAKTEYVIEENEKGKKVPRKIGMAPVQRDGMEYEFDLVADMDHEHRFFVTKSRCAALSDAVIIKPGADLAEQLKSWLSDGAKPAPSLADEFVRRFGEVTTREELESLRTEASAAKAKLTKPDMLRIKTAIDSATALLPEAAQGMVS